MTKQEFIKKLILTRLELERVRVLQNSIENRKGLK
jgi:hypothetical protein